MSRGVSLKQKLYDVFLDEILLGKDEGRGLDKVDREGMILDLLRSWNVIFRVLRNRLVDLKFEDASMTDRFFRVSWATFVAMHIPGNMVYTLNNVVMAKVFSKRKVKASAAVGLVPFMRLRARMRFMESVGWMHWYIHRQTWDFLIYELLFGEFNYVFLALWKKEDDPLLVDARKRYRDMHPQAAGVLSMFQGKRNESDADVRLMVESKVKALWGSSDALETSVVGPLMSNLEDLEGCKRRLRESCEFFDFDVMKVVDDTLEAASGWMLQTVDFDGKFSVDMKKEGLNRTHFKRIREDKESFDRFFDLLRSRGEAAPLLEFSSSVRQNLDAAGAKDLSNPRYWTNHNDMLKVSIAVVAFLDRPRRIQTLARRWYSSHESGVNGAKEVSTKGMATNLLLVLLATLVAKGFQVRLKPNSRNPELISSFLVPGWLKGLVGISNDKLTVEDIWSYIGGQYKDLCINLWSGAVGNIFALKLSRLSLDRHPFRARGPESHEEMLARSRVALRKVLDGIYTSTPDYDDPDNAILETSVGGDEGPSRHARMALEQEMVYFKSTL